MVRRTPQALLLDMDDTILADSDSSDRCWQVVCQHFAPRLAGRKPEELFAAIRQYRDWFWSDPERHRQGRLDLCAARQEITAAALLRLGIHEYSLTSEIEQAYSAQREESSRPFPGALETLHWLRSRNVRLALLTNGSTHAQRRKIEKWGLAPFFDCMLIEGEFGVGKPDERVYLHALEKLRVAPTDAWMAGDNLEWDVATPQRLGIYGVWVEVAGTGVPESSPVRPNRSIRTLSELRPGRRR
jgi:putative hydrolase of the HAD superfamily